MTKKRFIMLDNMRAVLILLVVFGHVLERVTFQGSQMLYNAIYSFHMPAMAFVSGLCFRRNRTNLWRTTILPYLIFQVVYRMTDRWINGSWSELQFSRPNWILWYLLALVLWQMITNLIDLRKRGVLAIAISIFCALFVGEDMQVGYFLSVSRTIVFLPFYLTGACLRENRFEQFEEFFHSKKKPWVYALLLVPAVVTQALLFFQRDLCQDYYLHSAVGYDNGYTMQVRLQVFITAAAAIAALCALIPKMKLPIITYVGKNTLPAYLLHGVLLGIAAHLGYIDHLPAPVSIHAGLLAVLLVLLLSSPPIVFVFNKAFFEKWGRAREKQTVSTEE